MSRLLLLLLLLLFYTFTKPQNHANYILIKIILFELIGYVGAF